MKIKPHYYVFSPLSSLDGVKDLILRELEGELIENILGIKYMEHGIETLAL